ncbi:hypothetical protein C4D60_Mb06t12000 [Musa balbisiana]|uniref:VAN3-binding protein-like auxin canalisation domain-containing protein n=1 Tax=Musa balbisiana TaxID=52838 RepID=A0A4S8IMK5_MUSBA|nr:hypothetical protein C4D60_Mb06t12000 [Musa balbisiana]
MAVAGLKLIVDFATLMAAADGIGVSTCWVARATINIQMYKHADGETRKQRRATTAAAAAGKGAVSSGKGSSEQRERRAAGGASGDRGSVCEQRQRRATTMAVFASSDSGEQ